MCAVRIDYSVSVCTQCPVSVPLLHSNQSMVNSNGCVLIYSVCGQSVHSVPLELIIVCLRVCFVSISGVLFWVCCFLVRF